MRRKATYPTTEYLPARLEMRAGMWPADQLTCLQAIPAKQHHMSRMPLQSPQMLCHYSALASWPSGVMNKPSHLAHGCWAQWYSRLSSERRHLTSNRRSSSLPSPRTWNAMMGGCILLISLSAESTSAWTSGCRCHICKHPSHTSEYSICQ